MVSGCRAGSIQETRLSPGELLHAFLTGECAGLCPRALQQAGEAQMIKSSPLPVSPGWEKVLEGSVIPDLHHAWDRAAVPFPRQPGRAGMVWAGMVLSPVSCGAAEVVNDALHLPASGAQKYLRDWFFSVSCP